jgi:outer membrane receptor protein involved in Fe transport
MKSNPFESTKATTTFLKPESQHQPVVQSSALHFLGRFLKSPIFLLLLLTGIVGTDGAQAQTSYGSIIGSVTDQSGAVVPGAQVSLKNTSTNATQTATTSASGTYSFVNLNPGSYSVTVSKTGFQSFTQNAVDVQIGGATRVNTTLPVGGAGETITVTAAPAQLQTDSPSLGGVVEGQQVVESPLNGRNVNNLLDFVPGVIPGGGTQGSTMANGGSGNFQAGGQTQAIAYGNYQIGGGFSGQSLFFIDGVGSNIAENNVNTLVPTQDAVQEFRVSTNDVSAEFGGFAGGVVQISTKSGSNDFHGNAYEYFRNTALDANDWFSNHTGLGKSPLHQNQYGANLGGPILRNKVFFFFSWEHESLISASPINATVPTTAELNGNFAGDPQIIFDPTTGKPFPGNIIPSNRIDPTALTILKLETPNESRVTQKPYTTNFFASAPIEGYQDQYNARVDLNPTQNDSIFARYTYWNPHNGDSDPFGTKTGAGPTGNYTQQGVLGENHVFNPTTIAELRLSYLENYNFQYPLSNGFDMSLISPNYGKIQSESQNKQGLLPGLGIQGYGIGAELSQLYWNNNVWGISGSITKILGKHTIKTGAQWRQVLWENYGNSQGLGMGASPFYTAASATDAVDGNALASFLLGIPSNAGISSVGTWHAFLHNYAFYVTDTFQATKNLTVNAGLRWEQPGAYSEENDLDTVLQPNASVSIGGVNSIKNPVTGMSVPLTGQLAFVNSPQYPSRREEDLHWLLFSPRLGFAYRLTPQTVVRSGYGISYLPAELTADSPGNSPINSAGTSISNTVGQPLLTTVDNPLPNGINLPSGRTQAGLDAALGLGIGGRIPNQAYGYAQQWNLAVERELDSKSTVTVAYAGAKGTHLVLSGGFTGTGLNLNQLPDTYHSLGSALLTQVQNPFYGVLPAGTTFGAPTIAEGYLLSPHPQYQSVNQVVPRYGNSTYNALQASYSRHFSHGGILQAAYTWAKLLSDTDNTSSFQDGQGGLGTIQDNTNLKAEKSVSLQDVAQNLVINYGLDLPFGRGEMYLSNIHGVTDAFIGGWRVNGITIFRSGIPIALQAAGNGLSQFGTGPIRPNYTPGCTRKLSGDPHSSSRANEWFNTSCFTQPGVFSFGNEDRVDPVMRSEGEANFDFSINKSFAITERVKLKFSSEIFDLFNHAQFALPNSNLSSPGFGRVGQQSNLPRTVQLALRVSF